HRLPAADLEADAVQGLDHAVARAELHGQVLHGQERRLLAAHVRLRGSMMSRRPSPIRLKQNTADMRASPGKSAIHHSPERMQEAPSATRMPHSGVGGLTPSPMKARPAAFSIAQPRLREAWTIIGGRQFG